jgi:uncharacterized protein YdeI (YjbR/CyaY-like superfamily)
MKRFKTAEEFFDAQELYSGQLRVLRSLLLETEMVETIKWGIPVYTLNGKNVVGTCAFKKYFGLWFYQGVFLTDDANVLVNAQEGKTKAMRQWRFDPSANIDKSLIRRYLEEAVENQKEGKQLKPEQKPLAIPAELEEVLSSDLMARDKFDSLTLGRRKDFAGYIETAKKEETKRNRLAKIVPMIKAGVGLNDKYS